MTDAAWRTTLDEFEARVHAQEKNVERGLVDAVPAFEPPDGLAPLPQDFVGRATDLVARCRALEARLSAALDDAREQLDRLGDASPTTAAPAQPVFFDSRV